MSAYKEDPDAIILMNEMSILDEETSINRGMIKGRQIARLIIEHFKTDRHIDQMWQLDDLFHLEYPGDAKLSFFRIIWHKIVTCLRGEITVEQCRKLLRRKLG